SHFGYHCSVHGAAGLSNKVIQCLRARQVSLTFGGQHGDVFKDLKKDGLRYAETGGWYANIGFWVGAIYRFGVWANSLPGLARVLPWLAYRMARACVRIVFNVDIWAGRGGSRIGAGLCLLHPSN